MIRFSLSVAGFVTAFIMATSAFAQTQGAAPAPALVAPERTRAAAAVGVDDGDRIVCRSVRYTGSRFPERECKTKKQLASEQEAAKLSVDKFLDRNRRNNVGRK